MADAIGTPMKRLVCRMGQGVRRVRMSEASKMRALVNEEAFLKVMLADTTSAGKHRYSCLTAQDAMLKVLERFRVDAAASWA